MLSKTLNKQGCYKLYSILNLSHFPRVSPSCKFSIIQNKITTEKVKISKDGNSNKPWSKAISEEQYLVKLKHDPDNFGPSVSENIIDEGDLEEEKFFEERTLPSQKLSTKKYADIIKSLIAQRKIKEAIDVLEVKMLKEDQFQPESYIYNLLLGACGRVGYTKKAFSLYNDMKKRGLKVTGGTYTALFNACANSPWATTDGLTRAKHLRNIMIEKLYEPNDTNYNAMIKAFGRCGDLPTAFSIVDEMMSKKIRVKEDSLNFLLQACITDKESGFRHALLVWRKMIKLKIKPNLYTYNLMLRTLRDCNLGDIETTQDVISRITNKEQIAIDENSKKLILDSHGEKLLTAENENSSSFSLENRVQPHNCVPNLMAKLPHLGNLISLSEIKKAEERLLLVGGMSGFLDSMRENYCTPDIKTYTLLLGVIPDTTAAENLLLQVMKKSTIKFDIDFFNMLIKKRSMRFDYEGAKEVLKLINQYHFKPNLVTYGVLALGCENKQQALELLEVMKASKYRLNIEILGAMLHQACYCKKFTYILEIMEICIRENIQPNKKFIEHLENFKKICRQIINSQDKLGQSKAFQTGFQIFRMRFKMWRNEIKMDESEDAHPWQQFQENTDPNTDTYFMDKDKSSRFKPRHISQFKVKTSPKYFANKANR